MVLSARHSLSVSARLRLLSNSPMTCEMNLKCLSERLNPSRVLSSSNAWSCSGICLSPLTVNENGDPREGHHLIPLISSDLSQTDVTALAGPPPGGLGRPPAAARCNVH